MEKYNKLTILSTFHKISGNQKRKFCTCLCDCGKIKDIVYDQVIHSRTKSCGCSGTVNNIHFNSKHDYNLDFFENPSEDLYYFLGLLYSDGNLSKRRNTVTVGLQKQDSYLLSKLSVKILNKDIVRFDKHLSILEITNKRIRTILESYGLYSNKSTTLTIPESLQNNSHFWRGMIDGDGSIFIRNSNKLVMSLCGTLDVIQSFINFAKSSGCITKAKPNLKSRHLYSFDFYEVQLSHNAALILCNSFYNTESDLYLTRKYEKYKTITEFPDDIVIEKHTCKNCQKEVNRLTKGLCSKCDYHLNNRNKKRQDKRNSIILLDPNYN